jgi:hypothetical protein
MTVLLEIGVSSGRGRLCAGEPTQGQHFVLACYLKARLDPFVRNSAKNNPYVLTFDTDGRNPKVKAPKKIFGQSDMYTLTDTETGRDLRLEHGLGMTDTNFTKVRASHLVYRSGAGALYREIPTRAMDKNPKARGPGTINIGRGHDAVASFRGRGAAVHAVSHSFRDSKLREVKEFTLQQPAMVGGIQTTAHFSLISEGDLSDRHDESRCTNDSARLLVDGMPSIGISLGLEESGLLTLVKQIGPHQWKVLKMLPSTTTKLQITQQQFDAFLERHTELRSLMRIEDNDAMVESYVMVDPHGRFFQNGHAEFGYAYSAPILAAGAKEAFQSITWSAAKFAARYDSPTAG